MAQGICPKCANVVSTVIAESIVAQTGNTRVHAISFTCSDCKTVLSVQLDPSSQIEELSRTIGRIERSVRSLL